MNKSSQKRLVPFARGHNLLFFGLLCCIISTGVNSAPPAMNANLPAAQVERVVASFTVGRGAQQVGLIQPSLEQDGRGPLALTADADGMLYLLDEVNGRVLRVDPVSGKVSAIPRKWLGDATDLVAVGTSVFAWTGTLRIVPTRPHGSAAADAFEHSDSNTAAAQAQFIQDGANSSEPLSPTTGLGPGPTSPLEKAEPDQTHSQSVPFGHAGMARWSLQKLGPTSSELAVVGAGPFEGTVSRFSIKSEEKTTSFQPLRVDQNGAVFVLLQSLDTNKNSHALVVHQQIRQIGAAGKVLSEALLPKSSPDFFVRRPVAIPPSGQIYALEVNGEGAKVLAITPNASEGSSLERKTSSDSLIEVPTELTSDLQALDRLLRGHGQQSALEGAEAPAPITRSEILSRAEQARAFSWQMSDANWAVSVRAGCPPSSDAMYIRPTYLGPSHPAQITGIPYAWGRGDWLPEFKKKIGQGWIAGNVCTCRSEAKHYCIRENTTGVDCSGFVSAAWNISHRTTLSLTDSDVSTPLSTDKDLLPGDALDRKGRHVRLFSRFVDAGGGLVEVYEAAPQACKGTVCIQRYGLQALDGYVPIRRTNLVDASPGPVAPQY